MISKHRMPFIVAVLAIQFGCTTFQYTPRYIAQGEVSVRGSTWNTEFYGGTKWIASTRSAYLGLETFVHCVALARRHAASASSLQNWSVILRRGAWVGGTTGTMLLVIGSVQERGDLGAWAGGLFGVAMGMTIGAAVLQHRALGHALDAMNHYNDGVGSLGRTCPAATIPSSEPFFPIPGDVAGPELPP